MSLSEEQQEIRRSGIGASEAAAVLGLSPWDKPIDVYLRKVGLAESREETPAMRLGNRLESIVLDLYTEETGRGVIRAGGRTLRHETLPMVLATPDGIVQPDAEPQFLVEAKTTSHDDGWGTPGTDEVPEHYLVQVAVQMAVVGAERCDVAVLNVLRRDFRVYTVRRDRALEDAILPRLAAFWRDHVEKQEPPPLDGSAGWTDYLKAKFPRHGEALVKADDAELVNLVSDTGLLKSRIKVWEALLAKNENALRSRIGDNLGLEGWWGKATWKRTADGKKTDWQKVALSLVGLTGPLGDKDLAEAIEANTTTTEGARRLLVSPSARLLEQAGEPGQIGDGR